MWDRIFELFLDTLVSIKDKKKLNGFVHSIFTPTERIMFAKRLAAALLLAKGHSYKNVGKILRMSHPTIAKMNFRLKYEGEDLVPIIEDIFRKQSKAVLIEELKDLFDIPTKSSLKSPDRFRRMSERGSKISRIKSEF